MDAEDGLEVSDVISLVKKPPGFSDLIQGTAVWEQRAGRRGRQGVFQRRVRCGVQRGVGRHSGGERTGGNLRAKRERRLLYVLFQTQRAAVLVIRPPIYPDGEVQLNCLQH